MRSSTACRRCTKRHKGRGRSLCGCCTCPPAVRSPPAPATDQQQPKTARSRVHIVLHLGGAHLEFCVSGQGSRATGGGAAGHSASRSCAFSTCTIGPTQHRRAAPRRLRCRLPHLWPLKSRQRCHSSRWWWCTGPACPSTPPSHHHAVINKRAIHFKSKGSPGCALKNSSRCCRMTRMPPACSLSTFSTMSAER